MLRVKMILLVLSFGVNANAVAAPTCEQVFKAGELGAYQFSQSKAIGLQIFERDILASIQLLEQIRALPKEQFLQEVIKKDLRKHFFRLQSIAALYSEKSKYEVFFSEVKKFAKEFEDLLGQIDLQKSLKERAEKYQMTELVQYFSLKQSAAENLAYRRFDEQGLLTNPDQVLMNLQNKINNVKKWDQLSKDRKFLAEVIAEKAEKLQLNSEKMKFDQADIELGLHELRRHLRWSVIQLALLDGALVNKSEVQLPPQLQRWFDEMLQLQPQLTTSKFIQRSEVQVDQPLFAPLKMTAMISQIVTEIGNSKDMAEMQLYFNEAAHQLGWSSMQIQAMNQQISQGSPINHQELAKNYQIKIVQTGLMREFAKWLMENNQ